MVGSYESGIAPTVCVLFNSMRTLLEVWADSAETQVLAVQVHFWRCGMFQRVGLSIAGKRWAL